MCEMRIWFMNVCVKAGSPRTRTLHSLLRFLESSSSVWSMIAVLLISFADGSIRRRHVAGRRRFSTVFFKELGRALSYTFVAKSWRSNWNSLDSLDELLVHQLDSEAESL